MSIERRVATIALVGRQNAGKTSLLMHLSGRTQHPVNFPGSSVERTEAMAQVGSEFVRIVDLPGVSSLEPISPDEEVTLDWLRQGTFGQVLADDGGGPDAVCAVVDAGKLGVELGLIIDLMTLGKPLALAITKADVASVKIDVAALSQRLGIPVMSVNAMSGAGAEAVLTTLVGLIGQGRPSSVGAQVPHGAKELDALASFVTTRVASSATVLTDRLDRVLLHRVFGLPILALMVFGIFQALFVGAEPFMGLIEDGQNALGLWVTGLLPEGALQSFLVEGLIRGMGSVLLFLPQIIFLMVFVTLLEASGYMARAAFLLDRILSKVGLSGRSFVPLVSSFACAVPAVLSTRMIDNERERLATIAVLPLMSCSARLPVYVILIGAFFPSSQAGLVLFSLYLLGIVIAGLVAWLLRRTRLRGPYAVLMMELPVYQRPALRVVTNQVWSACRAFLITAGTVILATAILIWILSYYPRPERIHEAHRIERAPFAERLVALPPDAPERATLEDTLTGIDRREKAAYLEQSFLAEAGKAIQPVFAPAGFDWRTTVGVLAAFPARELVIPTLGILYSLGEVDPSTFDVASLDKLETHRKEGMAARLRSAKRDDGSPAWTSLSALAVMVFFALCSQCMATLGAIRRETRSWRWPLFVFGYMTALAWVMAVLVYQIGTAFGLGGVS